MAGADAGSPALPGIPGAGGGAGPADADCDVRGYWIGRQTTISSALNGDQFASAWYVFQFLQDGETLTVGEQFDCGVVIKSANAFIGVTVEMPDQTAVRLVEYNVQTGRSGSIRRGAGNNCDLSFERAHSVRGADPAQYLPGGDPFSGADIIALQGSHPLPTEDASEGALTGLNGDDKRGVKWVVSGIASGARWSVIRDWNEYFSNDAYPVPAGTGRSSMVFGVRFDNEEAVLSTDPPGNATLRSPGTPETNDPRNRLELMWLGADRSAPEVQALLGSGDVAYACGEVQQRLPHVSE